MSTARRWTPLVAGLIVAGIMGCGLTQSNRGPPPPLGRRPLPGGRQGRPVYPGAAQRRPGKARRRRPPDAADPDRRRQGDGHHLPRAGLRGRRLPSPHDPGQHPPPLRRHQLRALGPARRLGAVRPRGGPPAPGRRVLSPRHDQGGVRGGRRPVEGRRRGAPEPLHGGPAGLVRRAHGGPLSPGLSRADPPSGRQAPRGRRPGARSQAPALPRAPGQGAGDRRVPDQRPGLDGHEGQPDRRRHRADRDLRGRALRLQGRPRGVRAGQGPGVEPPARPVHRAPAGAAAGASRPRGVQAGEAGQRLRPQRVRRRLLRRQRQRRIEDHCDQPTQRRGSAAPARHPPAPAQERDAGQVRPDPRPHRGRADRPRTAAAHRLRRLLRQRDVPRGGARPRHQEHDRREGDGPAGAQGAGLRAGGGEGGHPRASTW